MTKTSDFQTTNRASAMVRLVVWSALALIGASVSAQMAIPGKFEVTPIGAASYTIPIQVPPGVAGMEPKLALSYNSRAGNGILGVGWTLTGLPTITRCPRTTPQDGVKGSVAYDANDRFCLDGKRLMVVSGTYGADGSSYRTEIESFAKVTAFGSAGSGPQYFVVKTKDGQTMEFGNSADSRIPVAGLSTIRVWSLNKIADSKSNTQSIVYALPPAIATSTTEYNTYPQRVDYTSNSVTGLLSTNSVEFAYATRPDVISGYRGGYPFKTSVRLTSITTKTNGSVVSAYTPTYASGSGNRSTITSLSQCAAGLCAPITQFSIGSVTGSLFPLPGTAILPVTTTESSVSGGTWFSMDVNGDGLTDLVHLTALSGVYRVWLSKGDGSFTVREFSTTADTDLLSFSWQMLDVNGDGQSDLVHLTSTPGLVHVWTSKGDGTFAITQFTNTSDTDLRRGSWQALDVDGDGLADLVHITNNSGDMRVWRSRGDGTFAITQFANTSDTDLWNGFWRVLDVNGDGLADLLHFTTNSGDLRVWKSNGNGTFSISPPSNYAEDTVLFRGQWVQVDLNGDGLVDLVHMRDNSSGFSGGFSSWLSKGDGTFALTKGSDPSDTALYDGTWQVVDSGYGLPALIHTPSNLASGTYWVWRSNGDGTFAISIASGPTSTCSYNCTTMRAGDFLGTGAPGFVHIHDNTVKTAWFLSRQPSNIVTSVSDGLGGGTSWSLSPLPGMLVRTSYVKDIPSDSTTWTLASAIPVVESVQTNSGWMHDSSENNLDRFTYFTYGSARVERNGRGFLGFNWLQTKDSVTGLNTRTYYRQDFPYTGQVASQSTGSGTSWNNLSLTSTTYGCTLLDGGTTCTVAVGSGLFVIRVYAPGNRYFVYPSQVDSQSWDLDGTALPRTRVVNANPDLYGNLQSTTTTLSNGDGSATEFSKSVTNTYYNDPANWIIGRLVKSVVATSGPTVAAPVTPGSGGLPAAAAPTLPPLTTAALIAIIQLLLSD